MALAFGAGPFIGRETDALLGMCQMDLLTRDAMELELDPDSVHLKRLVFALQTKIIKYTRICIIFSFKTFTYLYLQQWCLNN